MRLQDECAIKWSAINKIDNTQERQITASSTRGTMNVETLWTISYAYYNERRSQGVKDDPLQCNTVGKFMVLCRHVHKVVEPPTLVRNSQHGIVQPIDHGSTRCVMR